MTRTPITTKQLFDVSVDDLLDATRQPYIRNKWDLRIGELGYTEGDGAFDSDHSFIFWLPFHLQQAADGAGVTRTEYDGLKKTTVSTTSFKAHRPNALIRSGSGQQKLKSTPDGTLLTTSFDYAVGWGAFGRMLDHIIIRRIIQWATAYSTDALRIWLHHGVSPITLRLRTCLQAALYLTLGIITILTALTVWRPLHFNELVAFAPRLPSTLFVLIAIAWLNSADLPRARNSRQQ